MVDVLLAQTNNTLQIYTVETGTPVKKCKSYKHLPYSLKYRSVDVKATHCKSVFIFFYFKKSSH